MQDKMVRCRRCTGNRGRLQVYQHLLLYRMVLRPFEPARTEQSSQIHAQFHVSNLPPQKKLVSLLFFMKDPYKGPKKCGLK